VADLECKVCERHYHTVVNIFGLANVVEDDVAMGEPGFDCGREGFSDRGLVGCADYGFEDYALAGGACAYRGDEDFPRSARQSLGNRIASQYRSWRGRFDPCGPDGACRLDPHHRTLLFEDGYDHLDPLPQNHHPKAHASLGNLDIEPAQYMGAKIPRTGWRMDSATAYSLAASDDDAAKLLWLSCYYKRGGLGSCFGCSGFDAACSRARDYDCGCSAGADFDCASSPACSANGFQILFQ